MPYKVKFYLFNYFSIILFKIYEERKKNRQKGGRGILNHLHEDVAVLKSWTRTRIWKCESDFSNIIV
jgi:hypothetical protein